MTTNLVLPRNCPRIFEPDGTLFPAFRELVEIYTRAHGLPAPSLYPAWETIAAIVNNWVGAERQNALKYAAGLVPNPADVPTRWNLLPMPEFAALNDDARIVRLLTECGFIGDLLPTKAEIQAALTRVQATIDAANPRDEGSGWMLNVAGGHEDLNDEPEAPGFHVVIWGGTPSPQVAKDNCTKQIVAELGIPVKRVFDIAGVRPLDESQDNMKMLTDQRPWAPAGPADGFIEPQSLTTVPGGMGGEEFVHRTVWDYVGKPDTWPTYIGRPDTPSVEYVKNVQAVAQTLGAGHHLILVVSIMPHPFHLITTQRYFWEAGVEGATYEFVFLLPTSPIPVERPSSSGVDGVGTCIKAVANAVAAGYRLVYA
jgi:hypothetical protein